MKHFATALAALIAFHSTPVAAQDVLGVDDYVDQTSAVMPEEPDLVPPMTQSRWRQMTDRVKIIYSTVTIETLQRGQSYRNCLPSDPVLFVSALDDAVNKSEDEGPLLLPVALVARAFCSGA